MPVIYGGSSGYYGGAGQFAIGTNITATGQFLAASGSASFPAFSFSADNTTGIYRSGNSRLDFAVVGVLHAAFTSGPVFMLNNTETLGWMSSAASYATDVVLARITAASLGLQGSSTAVDATLRKAAGNAGYVEWGSLSENLTLSTSGTTTNTAANLLPANSYIEYVTAFVTTTVATATSWQLGDATIAGRFTAAQSGAQLTAGATVVGMVHVDLTGTSGPRQAAATTLRVTTVGTPSAGAIRITSYYRTYTPATS